MEYKLLDTINSPEDLHRMDYRELELLCAEIREFLIDKVSKTGGHLSSNLGVIELTVALHRCLSSPRDMLVFDVGHQCYTHKLLTGRREGFDALRKAGGLSGFPAPAESEHDVFAAGHGSTSLSAAIGLARAKKLNRQPGVVVAVIGDGAFTGGMVYEGLNNIGDLDNLIIVLNDNKMSISKNVGALAHYLTRLRSSPKYYRAKKDVKAVLDSTPVIGDGMVKGIQSVKLALRKGLYHSTFFEEIGLRYIGPVDGHDLPTLCGILCGAHQLHRPLLLHIETKKGKGFTPAEQNPGAFHGVSTFDAQHITDPDVAPGDSFSTAFGRALAKIAAQDTAVVAITAAMKYGTGLQYMKKTNRDRFFDVGMAEEHAVTFAAALAAGGQKPVVAIYSTFLQRAYDQIIHDVVLQNRNVLLAIDRAGLVSGDGETHQGIYDAAFLSQQPKLPVLAPCNYAELTYWLEKLLEDAEGPKAIRYPRGKDLPGLATRDCSGKPWQHAEKRRGAKVAIVTYGILLDEALKAGEALKTQGVAADVIQLVQINPLPEDLLVALAKYEAILFAEEGIAKGGIGEHVALGLMQAGYTGRYRHAAITTANLDHAERDQLLESLGLNAAALAEAATALAGAGKKRPAPKRKPKP